MPYDSTFFYRGHLNPLHFDPSVLDQTTFQKKEGSSQENFFSLPEKASPPPSREEVIEKSKDLEKRGYHLPEVLRKLLGGLRKAWQILEKGSDFISKAIGAPLKYLGLALLIAGSIHIFIVLIEIAPLLFMSGGLMHLVVTLVTTGAIPTTLAGGSLYFFGRSLLKGETPGLHNFLNGFPIISYFMTLIPSNFSPANPHHQT